MQSDPRSAAALTAMAARRDRFRSAVALTLEQVRGVLDAGSAGDPWVSRVEAELGPFAAGRLDAGAFAAMFGETRPAGLAPDERAPVERAIATLHELHQAGDDLFLHDVPRGGSLALIAENALAACGRAFGAALVMDHVRQRVYRERDHGRLLDGVPFAAWNRAERMLAPPLVILLHGESLRVGALADLMDGDLKIVLLVDGPMPAAPLARLITPGTFVAQADDESILSRLDAWDGPGVVSIGGSGGALFVHDPARDGSYADRIEMLAPLPEAGRRSIGACSAAQQADTLRHLEALAEAGGAAPAAGLEVPTSARPLSSDPADRLTDWLLRQARAAEGTDPKDAVRASAG